GLAPSPRRPWSGRWPRKNVAARSAPLSHHVDSTLFMGQDGEDTVQRDLWWRLGLATVGTVVRLAFRLRFEGTEHIPRTGPALLACNHISVLDPPIVALAPSDRGRTVRFLAAAEF